MSDSRLYRPGQRRLQQEFDSQRIADRLEQVNLRTQFNEQDRALIEAAPFFFLATADASGQPGVSHKGGLPGFVRVVGPAELAFPDYDGNGMFISLGNILENPKVGLLFIDFTAPTRLVVRGRASVNRDDPLLQHTVGAQLVVRVQAESIYPNCPRYIHRMQLVQTSQYSPEAGRAPVEPAWKSFPQFSDAVPARRPTAGDEDE